MKLRNSTAAEITVLEHKPPKTTTLAPGEEVEIEADTTGIEIK